MLSGALRRRHQTIPAISAARPPHAAIHAPHPLDEDGAGPSTAGTVDVTAEDGAARVGAAAADCVAFTVGVALGTGVEATRGVGVGLGVGVTRAVGVAVARGVRRAAGVERGVGVTAGVGVGAGVVSGTGVA